MNIGKADWAWIPWDAPGVPSGGAYGDVAGFVAAIEPEGWKLAWSTVWEAFYMYEELPGGQIKPHYLFTDGRGEPRPLVVEMVDVFRHMRKQHADTPLWKALQRFQAEQKYKAAVEREQLEEDMRPDIIRATNLSLGRASPKIFSMPGVA